MPSLPLLALFFCGALILAPSEFVNRPAAPSMHTYVIIFRQSPREFTAADLAQRQADVQAWAAGANAAGHKLEPRILAPDVVPATAGAGEGAWPLTALLFLEAKNLEEAARVAAGHPAVRYGASLEVRPWNPPAPRTATP